MGFDPLVDLVLVPEEGRVHLASELLPVIQHHERDVVDSVPSNHKSVRDHVHLVIQHGFVALCQYRTRGTHDFEHSFAWTASRVVEDDDFVCVGVVGDPEQLQLTRNGSHL